MKRLIAILVSCLATCSVAHAGVEMNLVTKDGTGNVTGTIVISADADNVRMDMEADATSVIFLGTEMVVLDHNEQAYIVMDDAMIDQITSAMSEMEAQLAAMPPEQRAMLEQMMQGEMTGMMGGTMEKPPTPRVEALGSGSYGDYSCRKYAVFEGDAKVADYCSASFADIKGGEQVMNAMMGMIDFMQQIIDAMPPAMGEMMGDNPLDYIADIKGFPVYSLTYESGKPAEESTLESVTEVDLDGTIFAPPPNYRKQDTGM